MAKKRKRMVMGRDYDGWGILGIQSKRFWKHVFATKNEAAEVIVHNGFEGRPVRVKLVVVDGSET